MDKDTVQHVLRSTLNLNRLRAQKSQNINTDLFNFLENLLVFRTLEVLSVPQESGVKFHISHPPGAFGICLLMHVDNPIFPLVEPGVPRPDYVVLYLHGDGCLCTIVEMKSTAGKNLKHGLEQIKALADRLKSEFRTHLPPRFRLEIQGILLSQFNAQVPNALIAEMDRNGLTILPVQCSDRAELYPYVSKKNDLKMTRFKNERRRAGEPGPLETMLSKGTLRTRIPDMLTKAREGQGVGTGLHINFVLSEPNNYAVLMTRRKKCAIIVSEEGDKHLRALREDIAVHKLQDKFDVEPMPE